MTEPTSRTNRFFWLLGVALFCVQLTHIYPNLVDVPWSSEWGDLHEARDLQRHLTLTWLFSPQNNHPRVLSNLLKWLHLHLGEGDFRTSALFNYLFYFSGSALILKLLENRFQVALGFFFALLASARTHENHMWANQGLFFHFVFFTFLTFLFSFRPTKSSLWSILFCIIAFLSTSSGVGVVLIYSAANTAWAFLWAGKEKTKHFVQAAVPLIACFLWYRFAKFDNPLEHVTSPMTGLFWEYFLQLLANGFGFEHPQIWPFLVVFLFLLVSVVGMRDRKNWLEAYCLLACFFFALAAVTAGRAFMGLDSAKVPRYTGYSAYLPALFWLFLVQFTREFRPFLRAATLAGFMAFLTYYSVDNFKYRKIYEFHRAVRLSVLQQVDRALKGETPDPVWGSCHPHDMQKRLGRARILGFRFMKDRVLLTP